MQHSLTPAAFPKAYSIRASEPNIFQVLFLRFPKKIQARIDDPSLQKPID